MEYSDSTSPALERAKAIFTDTNFSSNVEDLVAAADYMQNEWEAPLMLMGHSLGGAAVLQAAHQIKSSE